MSEIYSLDGQTPEIDPAAWLAPGARVIGSVVIGAEASVWFNAVIRGDNDRIQIGARSNIQDGAVLHADPGAPLTIGEDCTIGHGAIVHGCTVGDGALIGMGATILNNAKIGRGALVGANALVTEGKEFPDHALILGAPAKVVKILAPDAAARLRATAAGYVARAAQFRAGLRPV